MWWLSGWCWLSPSAPPAVWLVGAEEPAWWAWGMRGQQKAGRMLQPGADYACASPSQARQAPTAHHTSRVGAEPHNVGITKCHRPWRRRGRDPSPSAFCLLFSILGTSTHRWLKADCQVPEGGQGWQGLRPDQSPLGQRQWCHAQGKCQEEVGSSWLCGTQGVSGPLSSEWALTQPAR